MVKHTQTIHLSVCDHFVRLALKGLNFELFHLFTLFTALNSCQIYRPVESVLRII